MFDRRRNLIFVHIQKTGGTSITLALCGKPDLPEKHFSAVELRDRYGREAWEGAYRFSIVRNPWDRLVAWWSLMERARANAEKGERITAFQQWVLDRASRFEEFLTNCDEPFQDTDGLKWVFRNQCDYLFDGQGNLMVHRVGRFENLAETFATVLHEAGSRPKTWRARLFPVSPPTLPAGRSNDRPHYSTFYTAETRALVAERYKRDIDEFGFSFETPA